MNVIFLYFLLTSLVICLFFFMQKMLISSSQHRGKTSFVEHRTFFHLYHSFHRLWIFLFMMFQVYTCICSAVVSPLANACSSNMLFLSLNFSFLLHISIYVILFGILVFSFVVRVAFFFFFFCFLIFVTLF